MTEQSDEDLSGQKRAMLVDVLDSAADRFGGSVAGAVRYGWWDRTAGTVIDVGARARWLRVVVEPAEYPLLDFWTGNVDANVIAGVRRPRVLDWYEPGVAGWHCRAELMELVTDPPCSTDPIASDMPALSGEWWARLAESARIIAATSTGRVAVDAEQMSGRLTDAYGTDLPAVQGWQPVHADLHWANLTAPQGWWLDWEGWGMGPAGLDAASLYLHSLTIPELARSVRAVFGDMLNGSDGRLCQLYIADRMARRGDRDDPEIDSVIGEHVDTLLKRG